MKEYLFFKKQTIKHVKLNLYFSIVCVGKFQELKHYFCETEALVTVILNVKFNNF